ncbi:flagellar assembly peptidoglycan hydrolase FlgJ [Arsukibacterium sp.]|uniref:flagellar assembly peptidoglycan hydrolase FlgJ n=1 Tax=Arsukibacterium sp. TaxID=1977258 RepID=UPI002FDABB1A
MKAPSVSYHDVASLQQIRAQDDKAGLRQAAEQFEAIFMSMLLTSMRKANAAFEAEGMMNSQTTEFYRDMHDSQLSTDLASKGALGLADLLVQQLDPSAVANRPKRSDQLLMPGAMTNADGFTLAAKPTDFAMPTTATPRIGPLTLAPRMAAANTQPALTKPAANQSGPVPAKQVTASEPVDWQISSPVDFVRSLLPAAKQAAKALGLDPMAIIAQAALETGWGQRMIKTAAGDNSFNLFGIKASRNWQGETAVVDTLEYRQGVAQREQARFRSYQSPEQSLADYSHFIANSPRYQQAVQVANEPAAYFSELQAAGYATDPNYAQKIMAVFRSPAFEQVRAELNSTQEINSAAED